MTEITVLPQPAPTQMLLKINFDADQESAQLDYSLVPVGAPTPSPRPDHGPGAGSIYFSPGEELGLQVTCSGDDDKNFVSFQIVDCAFVTLPQMVQRGVGLKTRFASPSPFLQARGAVHPLPLDFHATINPLTAKRRVITMHWKHTLNVGYSPGFWELSFIMTVRILRGLGAVEEVRVLSFDPESEVGTAGTLKTDAP